jgi:hypothetical protein
MLSSDTILRATPKAEFSRCMAVRIDSSLALSLLRTSIFWTCSDEKSEPVLSWTGLRRQSRFFFSFRSVTISYCGN